MQDESEKNTESVSGWIPGGDGRLRYRVGRGYIGPICWQESEIVRRIFVTVRDQNWQEIPPAEFRWCSEPPPRSGVRLQARHRTETIDFGWQASFSVDLSQGALSFEIVAEAFRDLSVCRLGLVVLHPVAPLVGNSISFSGDGGRQEMSISPVIHPQRIIDGMPQAVAGPFRELSMALDGFGVVEMKFAGERFEFEDQRNWGDASFKTYCTPLSEGFPRLVPAGSRISHRVDIRLFPQQAVARIFKRAAARYAGHRLPAIGLQPDPEPNRHAWSHVCLDSGETFGRSAVDLAHLPTGTPVELTGDCAALTQIIPRLQGLKVCRVLLHGSGPSPPSVESIAAIRRHLSKEVPVFVATKGYFADLNRGDLPPCMVDGIAFPLCSTVHGDDAETIVCNVSAIADMVETARQFAGRVAISPLSLYWPGKPGLQRFPLKMVAPWVVACVAEAAAAGVESITLAASLVRALGSSGPDGALILKKLVELSGCDLLEVVAAVEPNVHVIAAAGDSGVREALVANLNANPTSVKLAAAGQARGIVMQIDALSTRVFSLDEGSGVEINS